MLNESHDGACLDAMKSSSPPHIKLNKDFISDLAIGKNDAAYDAWMVSKIFCCFISWFSLEVLKSLQ